MGQTFTLTIEESGLHYFFPLFQRGVIIKTLLGGNIQDLLTLQLEIPPDYLENRIQTIFLDGKAVDNLREALVRDGSSLALSAAMPGLVGATLRRGGAFASLRRSITFSKSSEAIPQQEGQIVLKLFNLLVPELGPGLLAKGIWIKGGDLNRFLGGLKREFWDGCRELVMNGRKIEAPSDWPDRLFKDDVLVLLKVSPFYSLN